MRPLLNIQVDIDKLRVERNQIIFDKGKLKRGIGIQVSRPQLRIWNIRLKNLNVQIKTLMIELDFHPDSQYIKAEGKRRKNKKHEVKE